jgi:hypothetical protein
MDGLFNMDEMLNSINQPLQGNFVTEQQEPGYQSMSFFDEDGNEYELTTGMTQGQNIIKVRYRSNLLPLYINNNGYYISVFSGLTNDQPTFRTLTGNIAPTSSTFARWQPKKSVQRSVTRSLPRSVLAPVRSTTRQVTKRVTPRTMEVSMLSDEDLNTINSPATRRELARRQRDLRARTVAELDPLSDMFSRAGLSFGKNNIRKLRSDINYLIRLKF